MNTNSPTFPIGSNIYVKYIRKNGKSIYHDAKVLSLAKNNYIFVQWNTQMSKEWVEIQKCSLMEETSRLRNRNKVRERINIPQFALTNEHINKDASYKRRRKARNHAAFKVEHNIVDASYWRQRKDQNNVYVQKSSLMEETINVPDLQLPSYTDSSSGLPNGWHVKTVPTKKSNKGDSFWFTKTNKRLRSKIEVQMFLYVFEVNNENEELAWKVF